MLVNTMLLFSGSIFVRFSAVWCLKSWGEKRDGDLMGKKRFAFRFVSFYTAFVRLC